jgi:hypothetical protein
MVACKGGKEAAVQGDTARESRAQAPIPGPVWDELYQPDVLTRPIVVL